MNRMKERDLNMDLEFDYAINVEGEIEKNV